MVEKDLTKLDGLEDYLIELWQKIATDKAFTPKLNQQCFYCPAKCDLYKKLLKEQLTEDLVTQTRLHWSRHIWMPRQRQRC